jgi:TRAP-type C4-dicarboxylate transport system substrate-binding protein
MKKEHVFTSMVFLVLFVFLACSVPLQAQEKVVRLRYSVYFPPAHAQSKLSEEWCKEIEKRTEGRIKISYFPGGTLTPPMQTYDSTVKGIADIGQSLLSYAPGRLPLSEVLQQPIGCSNSYQATKLLNAYYRKFKPKEFDDVKVMYLHGLTPVIFHTKKAVSSIDDIKGLRFKANAENAGVCTVLGAVPVTTPVTETYDALQKGLLDGLLVPIEALKGWRFGELIKTSIENYAVSNIITQFVVMNKDKWNSISKADQEIIEKINEEWIEKHGRLWVQLDNESKEWSIQRGVKFIRSTKEEEAKTAEKMKTVLTTYVREKKAMGLPAEEALKFCQEYIKTHP